MTAHDTNVLIYAGDRSAPLRQRRTPVSVAPDSCYPSTLEISMRTNIEIDDGLMQNAMRCTGSKTKRGAVEAGLRLLVQTRAQAGVRPLCGKIAWQGDLAAQRTVRTLESGRPEIKNHNFKKTQYGNQKILTTPSER